MSYGPGSRSRRSPTSQGLSPISSRMGSLAEKGSLSIETHENPI
jgi:hypothetical protein